MDVIPSSKILEYFDNFKMRIMRKQLHVRIMAAVCDS